MNATLVIAPLLLLACVFALLIPVLTKLFRHGHLSEITPEWLESFSPENYRPMEALLADEDFDFLLRQPGFEASISSKLRRDRIRIFHQYLNRLISDFNRLHLYARYLISQNAESDQSAVLSRLIGLRVRFAFTVIRLEFGLIVAYFDPQPRLTGRAIRQLTEMSDCLYSLRAA